MSAAFERAMKVLDDAKAAVERLQTEHEEAMYASISPNSLLDQLRSLAPIGVMSVSLGHVPREAFDKLVAQLPGGTFGATPEHGGIRWYDLCLFEGQEYPRLSFQTDYPAVATP